MGRRRVGGAALVAAGVVAFAVPAGAAKRQKGEFETLPAGSEAGLTIDGKAELKRTKKGTEVKLHVGGLRPDTTYAAHLHNDACSAANPGGGHYMNDPAGDHMPPNELWISSTGDPMAGITTNGHGDAHGRGRADWVARDDARSVIIHAIPEGGTTAGGTKIACADLE